MIIYLEKNTELNWKSLRLSKAKTQSDLIKIKRIKENLNLNNINELMNKFLVSGLFLLYDSLRSSLFRNKKNTGEFISQTKQV